MKHFLARPRIWPRRLLLAGLGISAAALIAGFVALQGWRTHRELTAIFDEGVSLLDRHEYVRALERFQDVVRARPGWIGARFNAGLAAMSQRKDAAGEDYLPLAEKEFLETIRRDPDFTAARFCLGRLYSLQERKAEALEAFATAARLDPGDAHLLYHLGAALLEAGRTEEARKVLEETLRLQPALASALYRLGNVIYRKAGETEKTRSALSMLQLLKERREDITIGPRYGEAGKYSLAVEDPRGEAPPAPPPPAAPPPGPGLDPFGGPFQARARPDGSTAPPALAIADLDGDGVLDLVLCGQPGSPGSTRSEIWKGLPSGRTWEKRAELEADGVACAVGDLDGDGDADLVLAGAGAVRVLDNDGSGNLTASALRIPGGRAGFPVRILVLDADADWDLDILLIRQVDVEGRIEAALELLVNNRDGSFEDRAALAGIDRLDATVTEALFADLDGDLDQDILLLARPRSVSPVLVNDRAWRYRVLPATKLGGVETLLLRAGLDPMVAGLLLAQPDAPSSTVVAFADASGRPHVLRAEAGGKAMVIPAGPPRASWIAVDLEGTRSPEPGWSWANLPGIGGFLSARIGARSTVRQASGTGGGGGSGPLRIWFDLEGLPKADYVRILWPDGVLQSEPDLQAGRIHHIIERQRKPTSCPVVFAWNGERYLFVADILGAGGLGYLQAPGRYSRPDPTEVLELPPLAAGGGEIRLSIAEPLEEAAYLDALELVAADAPPGTTVHAEEMFAVRGPPPEARLLAFRKPLFPDCAIDGRGEDVADTLHEIDRIYPDGWEADRRFPGLAGSHAIILEYREDLPIGDGVVRPYLLLHGHVEYGSSTTNFAAAQAKVVTRAPTVSVDRGGTWVPLRDEWGFPAGTPRWMAVDLGGLLRPGDRRLRIETNLEVYWDQAFLASCEPIDLGRIGNEEGQEGGTRMAAAPVRITFLPPARAELRRLGIPRRLSPDGLFPFLWDRDAVIEDPDVRPFPGRFTAYGDVRDLTELADDALAILGPGDEILLAFDPARLPPLPSGWTRTFFLAALGWCKDMDLYTAASDRVEPLPFRSMTAYPPPSGEKPAPEAAARNAARSTRIVEPLRLEAPLTPARPESG